MPARRSSSTSSDDGWVSAHIYHHTDPDSVVLDVVAPVAAMLPEIPEARSWFFLRHWQGGPHIRLRVCCSTPAASREVRDLISRVIGTWRQQLRPGADLPPAAYLAQAGELRRIEPGHAETEPLSPTGTAQFRDFRGDWAPHLAPVADTPGLEMFLRESSEVACDVVAAATGQQRILHAVQVYCQAPLDFPVPRSPEDRVSSVRAVRSGWGQLIADGSLPDLEAWAARTFARQPAGWQKMASVRGPQLRRLIAAMDPLLPGSHRTVLVHALHTHLNRVGLTLRAEAAALLLSLRILEGEMSR
jgi:hypothetical protein